MGPGKYFFDLPVYRLPSDKYYADREAYVERTVSDIYPTDRDMEAVKKLPGRLGGLRDHLIRRYGGCWNYNEITGYIRLHFLGDQVRGEYFSVSAKRIVRTRQKVFEYQTWKLAPEVSFPRNGSNQDIWKAVQEYVEDCRKEVPRRFIDTELLNAIGPYLDWRAFLDKT